MIGYHTGNIGAGVFDDPAGDTLFSKHFKKTLGRVAATKAAERTPSDLDELWTAARVATYRADRQTSQIEAFAGYFFERVVSSERRGVVLDKLREFDLVPADETDPAILRDAFIVKVVGYVTTFGQGLAVLGLLLNIGLTYALLSFLVFPLVDWAMGAGQPADQIPDFFAGRDAANAPWWDFFSGSKL